MNAFAASLSPFVSSWLVAGAVVLVCFELLWLVALARSDVSIVDLAWAPAQALVATVVAWRLGVDTVVATIVLVSAWVWALRLSAHLGARALGRGEDRRYAAMRAAAGPVFRWRSAVTVFALQAVLATLLAAPLVAIVAAEQVRSSAAAALGGGLWLVGFTVESVADWQLWRFTRHNGRAGGVLDSGLWRYSRHPNYFGEALLHWGWGVIAAATGAWWALAAPAVLTVLLLKVSGVSLMEKGIGDRRPEYERYARRTSAFVPWPPRDR